MREEEKKLGSERKGDNMTRKFKIMLSFDVDAETLWTAEDQLNGEGNENKPVMLSQGYYGAEVAVPRFLRLLDKYEIKGTFFIPGATVEKHPDMLKEIVKRGHEVGNHGYTHTCPPFFKSREQEVDEYVRTSEAIKKVTGEEPKGFRAPSWEFSLHTMGILKDMGFFYDSTMMGSDKMGTLEVFGEKSDIVEIPINWTLDDAPFWLLSGFNWGAPMLPPSSVYEVWTEEFQYLYEESLDNVFTLTCHPQISGRPARIRMYERIIQFLKGHPDVEFMRCIDAAEDFAGK